MKIEFYIKAVELGNSTAMENLGICYETGDRVTKDIKKAFDLYQRGADLNHSFVMTCLAVVMKR